MTKLWGIFRVLPKMNDYEAIVISIEITFLGYTTAQTTITTTTTTSSFSFVLGVHGEVEVLQSAEAYKFGDGPQEANWNIK